METFLILLVIAILYGMISESPHEKDARLREEEAREKLKRSKQKWRNHNI